MTSPSFRSTRARLNRDVVIFGLALCAVLIGAECLAVNAPGPAASCGTDMTGTGDDGAWAPAPKVSPPFRSFAQAERRIAANRDIIDDHLTPADQDRLQSALVWGARSKQDGPTKSPELNVATELFGRAFAAITREFTDGLPNLRREFELKHARAVDFNNVRSALQIERVVRRLSTLDRTLEIDSYSSLWRLMQDARAIVLLPMVPTATRRGVVDRPIDEADRLLILGTDTNRLKFKMGLEKAFRADLAARGGHRARTITGEEQAWVSRCVRIPDLNHALATLFLNQPAVITRRSKVALRGMTRLDGADLMVEATFDSRSRYVSFRPPGAEGPDHRLFYRVAVTDRGALEILSPIPAWSGGLDVKLDETHFRY